MKIEVDIFKKSYGYDVQSWVKVPEDFEVFSKVTGIMTTTSRTDEHRLEILRTVEQHFKRLVMDYEKYLKDGIRRTANGSPK